MADRYECADFMAQDPSRVLQRYKMPHDLEVAAFISAMLSFGRRDLFLPKIEFLLDLADKEGGPFYWLSTGLHKKRFPPREALPEASFYRFYSHQDIHLLFCRLEEILSEAPSLGEYFRLKYQEVRVMTEKDETESKEKSCIKKKACPFVSTYWRGFFWLFHCSQRKKLCQQESPYVSALDGTTKFSSGFGAMELV